MLQELETLSALYAQQEVNVLLQHQPPLLVLTENTHWQAGLLVLLVQLDTLVLLKLHYHLWLLKTKLQFKEALHQHPVQLEVPELQEEPVWNVQLDTLVREETVSDAYLAQLDTNVVVAHQPHQNVLTTPTHSISQERVGIAICLDTSVCSEKEIRLNLAPMEHICQLVEFQLAMPNYSVCLALLDPVVSKMTKQPIVGIPNIRMKATPTVTNAQSELSEMIKRDILNVLLANTQDMEILYVLPVNKAIFVLTSSKPIKSVLQGLIKDQQVKQDALLVT